MTLGKCEIENDTDAYPESTNSLFQSFSTIYQVKKDRLKRLVNLGLNEKTL